MHQAPRHPRKLNIKSSSDNGTVAFEDLLEVAERAAKAGAAVCLFQQHARPSFSTIFLSTPHNILDIQYINHLSGHASLASRYNRRQHLSYQVVSERVDKPRNIEFKGATDLVTDTDKASEDAILSVRSSLGVHVWVDDVQNLRSTVLCKACAGAQNIIPRPCSTRRRRRHLG